MARDVPSAFAAFKSNLEITTLQQANVSSRQQAVRDSVARSLIVKDSFLTGSYRRHTMISPLKTADIDIFMVLDSSYYSQTGYAAVLDRVRKALLVTYPTTPKISRNGQAVTITFTDFQVDVVPAFVRNGGGYLIPSTTEQRWISTNPGTHVTFMANANNSHNGNLVPLIKMLKAWNRHHGNKIRSFYLELLIESILRDVKISNYSSGCRYVFDKGREKIKYTVPDPSGLTADRISGLAPGVSLQSAIKLFERAYNSAVAAESLAVQGKHGSAVTAWGALLGPSFPAFG